MLTIEELQKRVDAVKEYGSQNKAAAALNINRSSFQNSIKKAASLGLMGVDPVLPGYEIKSIASKSGDAWIKQVKEHGDVFAIPDGHSVKGVSALVDAEGRTVQKWVKTGQINDEKLLNDFLDHLIEKLNNHAPFYERPKISPDGDHALVVNVSDLHIGKLCMKSETGSDYNSEIAVSRMRDGVGKLLHKAECFKVNQFIVVLGNDILHIDHAHRHTTSGTPQDTDGNQWWSMFDIAKAAYVELIEGLAEFAPVYCLYVPSNHDFHLGYTLADTVLSHFRNHPNVTAGRDDKSIKMAHRKYLQYGRNLLAFTHGDGAKEADLGALAAHEAREIWAECKYVYWYLGHVHHKIRKVSSSLASPLEKDRIGFTVLRSSSNYSMNDNVMLETVRSPSPADRWHSTNGYVNMQAVEIFLHHPEGGQTARFTEFF